MCFYLIFFSKKKTIKVEKNDPYFFTRLIAKIIKISQNNFLN